MGGLEHHAWRKKRPESEVATEKISAATLGADGRRDGLAPALSSMQGRNGPAGASSAGTGLVLSLERRQPGLGLAEGDEGLSLGR